ncbi:hypothetical protein K443DRAFT_351801 [Laccaria amethystina LaAM-08-1]|uniref:Uncharacterized protein n=1 Tax=Laccaria amethystina LaAM-08-1 TaxID=1095629 RepID=A0A0C9XJY8_9AGAR|nr:hypothetical protein K443DRAFT_351801 [Laccaria amethystina LaAM-08-1]
MKVGQTLILISPQHRTLRLVALSTRRFRNILGTFPLVGSVHPLATPPNYPIRPTAYDNLRNVNVRASLPRFLVQWC